MRIFKKSILCWLFLGMLLLKSNSSISQNISESNIDAIIFSIDTMSVPFEKVKKLTSLSGENRYTKPTLKLILKSIQISEEENEPLLLAHSYYAMGNYYFYTSKTDSSLVYLNKAKQYAKESNDLMLESSILVSKGGVYSKLGNVILAISTSVSAKKILYKIDTTTLNEKQRIRIKGKKLVLNNSLANFYNKTEDFEKALQYYDEAYSNAVELKTIANASIILGNKGDLLIKTNQLEEALKTIKKSKKMKEEAKLPKRFIATSHLNIGLVYSKLKKYEKALINYDSAYAIYTKSNYLDGLMRVSTERGILYNAINRPKLALLNCIEGKELAEQNNDAEYIYKSSDCLFQAYKSLGNYNEALKNHEQYTSIKDSIFNEKNIRKVTQAGMQYEFDKIEVKQKLQIEKQKQTKNLILTGLLASGLLLIGLFIYFKKRIKYQKTIASQTADLQQQKIIELQQKNKLIALNSIIKGEEKERLRIAKELHDGVNGDLSAIKHKLNTLLDLNNKTIEEAMIMIDKSCEQVRAISHNLVPPALENFDLQTAALDYCTSMNNIHSPKITFNYLGDSVSLPKIIEINIYRIIQELVTNSIKHAEAQMINVQLSVQENAIQLTVEDDGKGFDISKLEAKGIGISNMKHRVSFLNGEIDFTSNNEGTFVNILIDKTNFKDD
ncbi:MAG: tetratricopeptide repeat protein [Flavobacteriaceae bacterium]|nr:tetratricopeptide repeat protein [Flavobacteriaceae bacterium]